MAELLIGKHCASKFCRQLDYLTSTCTSCSLEYCSKHIGYERHNCEKGLSKDVKVPVCPLCEKPVPVGKNEDANIKINTHIENGCPSSKRKIFTNKCNAENCKKKELIPIICRDCNLNYCISHRASMDHNCKKQKVFASTGNNKIFKAALPNKSNTTDDEALAEALQAILAAEPFLTQAQIDIKLAERLSSIQNIQNNRPNAVRETITQRTPNGCTMLYLSHLTWLILAIILASFVEFGEGQALNDPVTQYIEGRLGNRRVFWCPSGYGYLAYCPQPTDYDSYNWCCSWPYMGSWKPSCCQFAIPTGAVVAIIISSILLLFLMTFLGCWCMACCPLYKQLYENESEYEYEEK
uniref:AN1-type domain-containing protein n=1 Tax=Rhabditophanes sp. KR3021 TaxID=114890 RepID=A0AC35TUE5_9BILA